MLFDGPSEDQNVIQVYYYNAFHNKISEYVIYYCLEDGWTNSHPKEYHQGFKQAMVGVKGSLPLISGLDVYVVEIPAVL